MTPDQVRHFRSQFALLQRRLRREANPVLLVSRSAHEVLTGINRLGGGTSPGEVADELGMRPSNIAAALRELESAGLISRGKDESDSRRVNVYLTERGHEVVEQRRNERDVWLNEATAVLLNDREQRVLIEAGDLLERLARYEPESASGDPRPGQRSVTRSR